MKTEIHDKPQRIYCRRSFALDNKRFKMEISKSIDRRVTHRSSPQPDGFENLQLINYVTGGMPEYPYTLIT